MVRSGSASHFVDGLLEKPVFIGSGFTAAQHPGMTLEWWPTSILAF
jgi:hypothetical protein